MAHKKMNRVPKTREQRLAEHPKMFLLNDIDEDGFLTAFRQLGFPARDTDELYQLMFDQAELVESKPIGFQYLADAWEAGQNYPDGETLYLCSMGPIYFVAILSVFDDHDFEIPTGHLPTPFATYQEAKEVFDAIPYGVKPLKQIFADLHAQIGDPKLWIQPIGTGCSGLTFRIYYNRNLIADHVREIRDADHLRDLIARYQTFAEALREQGCTIQSITKRQEFPGNQRYYVLQVETPEETKILDVHIPSKLQGRERCVFDLVTPEQVLQAPLLPPGWDKWFEPSCYGCTHRSHCGPHCMFRGRTLF